jgi:uncharacterized protein YcaQ
MTTPIDLDGLRRMAATRSLFPPTSLEQAVERLGFIQADPIRAPARAQDLTLRHRVAGYRAGDLERRYPGLDVEEDVFINYGFVSRPLHALMHPRTRTTARPGARGRIAAMLAFVRERGTVHPRQADEHFAHGSVTNFWGGSSTATTHLLEAMHYRGLLRVARRDGGIRVYALQDVPLPPRTAGERRSRIDALVDVLINKYGPVPAPGLSVLVSRLRYAVPQWRGELKAALLRARLRLTRARVDGVDWYWPSGETLIVDDVADTVRLLAPFDPVVWDRRRFEMLWGWAYRFEAYTPVARRQRGYYALPLLWREHVIGWANLAVTGGVLKADVGYVAGMPRDRGFKRALASELDRMRVFLGLEG